MSKGPGKSQKLILAELADHQAFRLRALLGPTYPKAQYNALLRATMKLEADGKISVHHFLFGKGRTVVHRVLTTFTGQDRRDKCW